MEHGSLGSGAYRSVGEWLEAIKMGRYTEIFMENGYSSMDAVAQVTLEWVIFLITFTWLLGREKLFRSQSGWGQGKSVNFCPCVTAFKEASSFLAHIVEQLHG